MSEFKQVLSESIFFYINQICDICTEIILNVLVCI